MRSVEITKSTIGAWVAILALSGVSAPPAAFAQAAPQEQDELARDAGAGGQAAAVVDAGVEEPSAEAASEAKRVVRIRRVLEVDKDRLRFLRSELRSRTQWFEDLAAGMGELAKERNAKRETLDGLESDPESDPEAVAALRAELDELQEDYELYDTQTDLALKAEKTVRKQIEALEKKIEKDELALGRLTGEIPAEVTEAPPSEPTAEKAPADAQAAPPVPLPLPTPVPSPERAPKVREPPSVLTATQLQAQKVLERKEREVEIAKLGLSEFVERKRALVRQIEFEQQLDEGDAKELQNLRRVREILKARLAKYSETGAPAEKIARRERGSRIIDRLIQDLEKSGEDRAQYLELLRERLAQFEEAQLGVTREVDEKQEEVARARRRVKWLESPIHPKNIQYWAKERGPRILLVVAVAALLLLFVQLSARRIARTVVRRRRDDRGAGTGRADTLAFSFRSASRVLIVLFGALLVLQEAGVDIKTVLGGAAIIGVAIAFGAQDLMKDYFSGFLILLEDQYQLGDLVTIGGITGTVESVNMRVTVLRDLEGRVHFIPNGNIDHVTNRTYAWGRPVFEIPVGFDEDVDRVMEILVATAKELAEDPDWKGRIIGDPDMLGVDKFTDYGVFIKFMVKTQPDQLFPVRREMLRRISKRFNELGIRITVPHRILIRDETDAEA